MDFAHAVNKDQIPLCPILGVDIAAVDMAFLVDFTRAHLSELSGDYICVANVHTTVTAFEDPSYRKIQNGAILAIPDGGPLSALGRKRGFPRMQRTTGPEYMEEIFRISGEQGYRHFFYGSTQETLDKLSRGLEQRYPGLEIAGMYSPPFRPLTREEDAQIIDRIRQADPDFLWVGLGAPKQEIWMAAHQGRVSGLMVGVGAGFDYFAGNLRRAPEWMQKHSLEWLYRLLQEPRRLAGRYLRTNSKFIWHAVLRGK